MKIQWPIIFGFLVILFPHSVFADPPWRGDNSHPRYRYSNDRHYGYDNRDYRRDEKRYGYSRHSYPYQRPYNSNYSRRRDGENLIWQGIRSGALSEAEVRDLREQRYEIAMKEREYLRDGRLSSRERESLRDLREDFHDGLHHNLKDGERRPGSWYNYNYFRY